VELLEPPVAVLLEPPVAVLLEPPVAVLLEPPVAVLLLDEPPVPSLDEPPGRAGSSPHAITEGSVVPHIIRPISTERVLLIIGANLSSEIAG
jgi:hypothetical protein